MAATSIARRYAEAAFDVASESGGVDRWQRDLHTIADSLDGTGLAAQLDNTKVPFDAKADLIRQVFDDLDEHVRNVLLLAVQRGRVSQFPAIVAAFDDKVDAYRGIARAVVTTAVPIDDAERDAIARRLSEISGKQITMTTRVDPAIMGGFIARIGDTVLDGSARTRLEALRRRLVG